MGRPNAEPLLAMEGVVKRFGGVQALRGVDFDLRRGEIHALLGENRGKSTLMNILSGVVEPDAGAMRIDGMAVRFADPRAAQAMGVATIFQELGARSRARRHRQSVPRPALTKAGVLDRAAMRVEAQAARRDQCRYFRRSARRRAFGRQARSSPSPRR